MDFDQELNIKNLTQNENQSFNKKNFLKKL